jgi:mycothiol synthase
MADERLVSRTKGEGAGRPGGWAALLYKLSRSGVYERIIGWHISQPARSPCSRRSTFKTWRKNTAALLRKEGYYVGFTTLELDFDPAAVLPPAPPLPAGLELRPALPEHIPQIIASIIECYENAFPGNRFRTTFDRSAYFTAEFAKPKYDRNLWYIAWDGDQVAGQVLLVRENGEVYVSQVSVRPAWRRMGLARALLVRALHAARRNPEDHIWIDTYAEYSSRAVDLYTELGFKLQKEYGRYRKDAG